MKSFFTYQWEPSQNQKVGYESLFVENEQGNRYEMARMYPSNSKDHSKGFTLVKRDMNYGLDGKFIPQGDGQKEWNLAYEGAKERGAFFAREKLENALHMIHGRNAEMTLVEQNGLAPVHQENGIDQSYPTEEVELER